MRRLGTAFAVLTVLLLAPAAPRAATRSTNYFAVTLGGLQDAGDTAPRSVGPVNINGGAGSTGVGTASVSLGRLSFDGSCLNPISGLFTPQVEVRGIEDVEIFEMTCPGAPATPSGSTPLILHTVVDGHCGISGPYPYTASLDLSLFTASDYVTGSLLLDNSGMHSSGFLTGISPVFGRFPVDIPLQLFLSESGGDLLFFGLDARVGGQAFGTDVNSAEEIVNWEFAAGPVFSGLPEGVTINIPGLNIVNNVWQGPSSSTAVTPSPVRRFALAPVRSPFRGPAHLSLTLPADGEVRVDVFDVRGARVATLADGWRPAGAVELEWAADRAPSGVYFARATHAGRTATARFVIAR
jgi:hypothetical protein